MATTLRIVADAHIHGVRDAFTQIPGYCIELRVLEHQAINRMALRDADILITRSSTRVDASLLEGTPVRFAATATIGDDHYDKDYLVSQGIAFANAAGSSTDSVIEYMLTALFELHARGIVSLPHATLGIIGAGRIGGKLQQVCESLGMRVLINDPPRARRELTGDFHSLDELLAQSDILTLHTPLIRTGRDATLHLLNAEALYRFRGHVIMNAARGACVNNHALFAWLSQHQQHYAVMDCWEKEPQPDTALISHPQMLLATPHIAGHSLDGKAANTWYVYRALCHWLDVTPRWDVRQSLPADNIQIPEICCDQSAWDNVHRAAIALYPIARDHAFMQSLATKSGLELAVAFSNYRRHYPVRRAWSEQGIRFRQADTATLALARAAGMKIV